MALRAHTGHPVSGEAILTGIVGSLLFLVECFAKDDGLIVAQVSRELSTGWMASRTVIGLVPAHDANWRGAFRGLAHAILLNSLKNVSHFGLRVYSAKEMMVGVASNGEKYWGGGTQACGGHERHIPWNISQNPGLSGAAAGPINPKALRGLVGLGIEITVLEGACTLSATVQNIDIRYIVLCWCAWDIRRRRHMTID